MNRTEAIRERSGALKCRNGVKADVARYVVTGVGFLGAGTIFVRGNRVQGLTTSAGIWVMAAISKRAENT